MLGALLRVLVFVALVAAATWAVSQLLAAEGEITIAFAGAEYVLTPFAAGVILILAAAALLFVVWLGDVLVGLVLLLLGDPAAVRRFTERGRRRRGVEVLDRALMALAVGDPRTARARAAEADRLLRRPGLGRLLNAQAAELAGDRLRAQRYWTALAEEPETAMVGLRGLLSQAMSAGEEDRALKLAERAAELAPRDTAILDTLYGLQSRRYDWAGARRTLGVQRRMGTVARPEADRREAALALALSEEAETAGDREAARRHAVDAARLNPGDAEIAATAARHLVQDHQKRAAARVLVDAWRCAPSPLVARAFAEIEPEETPGARRKRFARLFEANAADRETIFLRAELALLARDWDAAREAVAALDEAPASARTCAIMAAIARGEGEPEAVVRAWLARALGAPRAGWEEADLSQAAMLPLLVDDETAEVNGQAEGARILQDPPGEPEGPRGALPEAGDRAREAAMSTAEADRSPRDRPAA